jgi:hypothetical protein
VYYIKNKPQQWNAYFPSPFFIDFYWIWPNDRTIVH